MLPRVIDSKQRGAMVVLGSLLQATKPQQAQEGEVCPPHSPGVFNPCPVEPWHTGVQDGQLWQGKHWQWASACYTRSTHSLEKATESAIKMTGNWWCRYSENFKAFCYRRKNSKKSYKIVCL